MQHSSKIHVTFILFIATLTVVPLTGQAQNVWVEEPDGETEIGLDFRIPAFGNDFEDVQGIAFANYLYSNIVLGNNTTLQLDLPLSHYSNGGGEANFGIGNPYVGVQFGAPNAATKFDLGVRLPLLRNFERAHFSGIATENYTRGAFIPKATTIVSNIHYRYNRKSGLGFRIGGGPEAFFPSGGSGEVLLKSYIQLLYRTGNTTIGSGLNGRWYATASGGDFSDQSNFNFGLLGSHDFGSISAGAYLEVPIDNNLGTPIDYMLGLNLSFEL